MTHRAAFLLMAVLLAGCGSRHYRESMDRAAYGIIQEKQGEAFGRQTDFTIEKPSEALRAKLLLSQNLPMVSEASLGAEHLERIDHWPKDGYLAEAEPSEASGVTETNAPIVLDLIEALQVAAQNNRNYQSNKEGVFQSALELELERDAFRTTWAGVVSGRYQQDRSGLLAEGGEATESATGSGVVSAAKRLKNGMNLTLSLGWEVIKLLEPDSFVSDSTFGDASVSIPLWRGAGRHIVMEPLKQAERDVIYALYDFEDFKREFAVSVADGYFSVLQRKNEVTNAEENYRSIVTSTRRARRLLDAGDLPAIQVDQAIQDELSARNRWVNSREAYASALDSFKLTLGLPTDARVELDESGFERLSSTVDAVLQGATNIEYADETVPPADAPVELEEPSQENAGPLEIAPERAIDLALENRLDLRVALGRVYDSQRQVVIAANRLKPEVTLFGGVSFSVEDIGDLGADAGDYEALLNIDLPLERTSEAAAFRSSYIRLEGAIRNLQELEDEIKLSVLDQLRQLRESRESLRIQALSVELARRRVRSANMNLQAGRIEIRDLLEAQEDLLSAQNALTSAKVDYRLGELELQRDLGLLEVDSEGLWKEYRPGNDT